MAVGALVAVGVGRGAGLDNGTAGGIGIGMLFLAPLLYGAGSESQPSVPLT
jgi:hypothetical protein